eukprot:Plantae.Rhodophyta-Rhodochaete_pulchella.ctg64100.p1 GENE.Plantae.Rhodophyta-Rhodochaete_pulchella.ctg64100~~Plantae.Rhodophyta-Rhodochaete_pulchella.ctg64100.p1  ORF type:complete len:138 (-),score=14.61 Plantae.Rhodophyta-Rhodochaete_pulchella.ctg64100:99-512(-)
MHKQALTNDRGCLFSLKIKKFFKMSTSMLLRFMSLNEKREGTSDRHRANSTSIVKLSWGKGIAIKATLMTSVTPPVPRTLVAAGSISLGTAKATQYGRYCRTLMGDLRFAQVSMMMPMIAESAQWYLQMTLASYGDG